MTAADKEFLYKEYRGKVLGYIRTRVNNREDAEDLCEDVFLKAFQSPSGYDAAKAAPGTWIYTITKNTVIDYFRRQRPTEELPEDLADEDSPEDSVENDETLEELANALARLPADLKDIIVMCYYDRRPLTEIAMISGISYGAVKLKHQKALALLRCALE